MSVADGFTLSRIVLAPVFYVVYFLPVWTGCSPVVSALIMLPLLGFAEFTDFLDGFFARRRQEVSDFGKLFDPFADVLLHLTTFFCLVVSGYMPGLIFMLILYREFGMIFIRLLAVQRGVTIGARRGGKLKTVLYVVASFFCLGVESCRRFGLEFESGDFGLNLGRFILFGACLLASYASFVDYIVYFREFTKKTK